MRLDDWLPALHRAAQWNQWSEEELLIQLAGHLRGRALQEWNLLEHKELLTSESAISALRSRLESGMRVLAAQDFRHTSQRENESTADFIRRLERTFKVAYGYDSMSVETRETILYSQLQEGLHYDLMKSPAVSGAQNYKELCLAAKNEEKRQAELRKRQEYHRRNNQEQKKVGGMQQQWSTPTTQPTGKYMSPKQIGPRCYACGRYGHIERNCRMKKPESRGQTQRDPTQNRRVEVREESKPEDFLYSSTSDSEDGEIRIVKVNDEGSQTVCAKVQIAGVPAYGIIDSGADITILGGELFKKVAAVARLKKKHLKKADKLAKNYDQGTISLDGRMDLDITFQEKTLNTPVYIKMDAPEQLLLSEGVCRQLGILTYHLEVQRWRGGRRPRASEKQAKIPMVRVRSVQSVRVLPLQSTVVNVQLDGFDTEYHDARKSVLLEPHVHKNQAAGLQVEDGLLQPSFEGKVQVVTTNHNCERQEEMLTESHPRGNLQGPEKEFPIQVHQNRICRQNGFPSGFYWYENNQRSPGKTPKWIDNLKDTDKGTDSTNSNMRYPLRNRQRKKKGQASIPLRGE